MQEFKWGTIGNFCQLCGGTGKNMNRGSLGGGVCQRCNGSGQIEENIKKEEFLDSICREYQNSTFSIFSNKKIY